MKLVLSPKDTISKIELSNVDTFAQEGQTLLVIFSDGSTRNYPLQHLWYYESQVSSVKTKPVKKQLLND